MDANQIIFYGICILNPFLQNVGMGMQKWSINNTPKSAGAAKAGWIAVWVLGLVFQIAVALLAFKALAIGNASVLGAFAGSGLIFLALFSFFVLKEKIVKKELLGIAVIIFGTAVMAICSREAQTPEVHLDPARTAIFFGPYVFMILVAIAVLRKNLKTVGGAIFGMIAGSMNGIGVATQKIVTCHAVGLKVDIGSFSEILTAAGALASSAWTWIMIAGGIGGVVVVQFGYKYGKAVQVVPGHASMVVMVPALAGAVLLGETVNWLTWLAIAVIAAGVLITTTADPKKHVP